MFGEVRRSTPAEVWIAGTEQDRAAASRELTGGFETKTLVGASDQDGGSGGVVKIGHGSQCGPR
jgi:hypothetical protein